MVGGKGGGTETNDEVAGRVVGEDGNPAAYARVQVRPSDYLSDLVSSEHADAHIRDTVTDAQGRFALAGLPSGEYRIEIAGAEARGSVHDFFLPESGTGLDLPPDTLRTRGSISGSIVPDSDSQMPCYVQVFGMERLVQSDPQGNFVLYTMPRGEYEVRLTAQQPFRREAVLHAIKVEAGKRTSLDPVALAKEAKLSIRVDSGGVQILGLDSTNPVLFDNERWDNGPDDEYIWAKTSAGSLDLRGTIVTRDFHNGLAMDAQLKKARQELQEARLAGFANLPEVTPGATAKLSWPASGRLEDIVPMPSAGSELIVAEARKATPEKPLLVVAGGALTTVANAWLTDPSIAPRMVVAGVYTYSMEPEDSAANYLVARKCRFVQWGRDYTWGGKPDTSLIRSIPPSLMGNRVRGFLTNNTGYLAYGDIAPIAYLFDRSVWKTADIVKVNRAMEVQPASDINFDFVDIPLSANAWAAYQAQFYAGMANPAAYHPIALPGRVEAEAYGGMAKASPQILDSATWNESASFADGGYAEYRIAPSAAGTAFKAKLRYRSEGGADLALSLPDGAPLASIALPASADWSNLALPDLALPAGAKVIRVTISGGSAVLDWLDLL